MNAELINAINQILISDLHYTEDMLLTPDNASKYDWFNNLINLKESKWFLINFQMVIAGLRNMGIQIPVSEWENKWTNEFTQADYDAAKNLYEKIIADESIKKFIPSRDVIRKIMIAKSRITMYYEKRANQMISEQFYGVRKNTLDFLGHDGTIKRSHKFAGTASPYLINDSQCLKVGCLCTVDSDSEFNLGTKVLKNSIHELNHGLEVFWIPTEDDTYLIGSGWDIYGERNNHTHKLEPHRQLYLPIGSVLRNNELMSEVINELIARDVFEIFKTKIDIELEESPCAYSHAFFALEDFYKMYKEEIIESRQSHNMQVLYDRVGRENFEELENLLRNISIQLYSGNFDYYQAFEDINKGIENEATKLLSSYIHERDRILSNMLVFSQGNQSRGIISIYIIILVIMIITIVLFLNIKKN